MVILRISGDPVLATFGRFWTDFMGFGPFWQVLDMCTPVCVLYRAYGYTCLFCVLCGFGWVLVLMGVRLVSGSALDLPHDDIVIYDLSIT